MRVIDELINTGKAFSNAHLSFYFIMIVVSGLAFLIKNYKETAAMLVGMYDKPKVLIFATYGFAFKNQKKQRWLMW